MYLLAGLGLIFFTPFWYVGIVLIIAQRVMMD